MTSPVSAIEAIEKAMEGVTPGPWKAEGYVVMGDWYASGGIASVRSGARAFNDAAYIAACNPVAMREVLAAARKAEALTGIGSAHDLISDWLGEGTDDLPDDTPVRIDIGKRTIIADNLGSLRRARALLGGENAE